MAALLRGSRSPVPDENELILNLDGYEGPLDLLLGLARTQKVDITRISILALADQYLAFVENARKLRLQIAADYLVMAAWLAFLKSRLLLPVVDEEEEMSGEELASYLAFRLQRLNAMREAAARLMARNRLGRDVFARGAPEPVVITRNSTHLDSLYDLLRAYADQRQRNSVKVMRIERQPVLSLKEARRRLERLLGISTGWMALDEHLDLFLGGNDTSMKRRTTLASSFTAMLELVREGEAELRQSQAFAPIYFRARPGT
jgi:segregation and condensation protein A